MIFFTADNHFCHNNIIGSCERPFADLVEMNQIMIQNWNSLVSARDEVYILGDFLYKGRAKDANEILAKLKGRKYLIIGNHERYITESDFNHESFEWEKDYFLLKYEGRKFILSHYPFFSWDGSHRGSIHLYGHVHNSGIKYPEYGEKLKMLGSRAFNVGVDVNDFYPVSIKDIIARVESAKRE